MKNLIIPYYKNMMRKVYLIAALFSLANLFSNQLSAQDLNESNLKEAISAKVIADVDTAKAWKTGLVLTTNFTTVGLSNWAAGGQDNMSLASQLIGFANYKKDNHTWRNYLELGYGLTRIGKADVPFRKSDDRIVFTTRYSVILKKPWFVTVLGDFRTQFAEGYKYTTDANTKLETTSLISNIMAPGYAVVSPGIEYRPGEIFYAVVSPATLKATYVLDKNLSNAGAYGVKPGSTSRYEFGAYLNTVLHLKLMENIDFISKGNLFMNYKNVKTIDVFWDNIVLMKINKYVSASFNYTLIYDDDITTTNDQGQVTGPALQRKYVLSVGLAAKIK